MQVRLRTTELEECFYQYRLACKIMGNELARRYIQRVGILKNAENVPDLLRIRGLRCHPLEGARSGQWAISLDRFNRLIFTIKD